MEKQIQMLPHSIRKIWFLVLEFDRSMNKVNIKHMFFIAFDVVSFVLVIIIIFAFIDMVFLEQSKFYDCGLLFSILCWWFLFVLRLFMRVFYHHYLLGLNKVSVYLGTFPFCWKLWWEKKIAVSLAIWTVVLKWIEKLREIHVYSLRYEK